MATLKEIAKDYAIDFRSEDAIAWVIIWKTGRSWNAQEVWLNTEDDTLEPEDLRIARKVLEQDKNAVMLNGYYCGHFWEEMTLSDVADSIRWHYDNGCNQLQSSTAFPNETT